MIQILKNTLFLLSVFCITACANNDNVLKNNGIVNDGKTMNTKALQKVIDECSENGGGLYPSPKGNT